MSAGILAGYVAASELEALFKLCLKPNVTLMLESLTDLKVLRVDTNQAELSIDPTHFEEGRIFDAVFELHWQRLRGYPLHILPFRVSLVHDDITELSDIDSSLWQSSLADAPSLLPLIDEGSSSFYLWGQAVRGTDGNPTGEWYEKEVPRLFNYPCICNSNTRRAKLVSKCYRLSLPDGETILLNRCESIVAVGE